MQQQFNVIAFPSDGDDEVDANLVSLIKLDPRLVHLKKRLQNKRELTRQLQKMLSSFSGDTNCRKKIIGYQRNTSNYICVWFVSIQRGRDSSRQTDQQVRQ